MSVYIAKKPPQKDLKIELVEKDGEVCLTCNGHAFVRCFTNAEGKHIVQLVDIDTGRRAEQDIACLCWPR